MIRLEGVTKAYGSGANVTRALDDISLTLGEADFVVVLGPSGSGKTTLLNIIGALDTATSGRIVVAVGPDERLEGGPGSDPPVRTATPPPSLAPRVSHLRSTRSDTIQAVVRGLWDGPDRLIAHPPPSSSRNS